MQRRESAGVLQRQEDFHTDKGADHENLAVREIDELQNAVYHGVAQSNQGVHEPQDESVEQDLRKYGERDFQRSYSPKGRRDYFFFAGGDSCSTTLTTFPG